MRGLRTYGGNLWDTLLVLHVWHAPKRSGPYNASNVAAFSCALWSITSGLSFLPSAMGVNVHEPRKRIGAAAAGDGSAAGWAEGRADAALPT